MRATLLPTPGDPYIAALWLKAFQKFCMPDAGQLYVMVNSGLEEPVFKYTCELYEKAGARVLTKNHLMSHGFALVAALQESKEDHVFIMEDDFFILEHGHVARWFEMIEKGEVDAVVSPRGCCDPRLSREIIKTFHLTGQETDWPNFWPSLVLTHRDNFCKTDLDMEAHTFKEGETIPQLNFTPNFTSAGDTFVWMSIQLRGLGLKFHLEDQCRLCDVMYAELYPPPWVHIGSTSLTLNGSLLDERMKPLGNRGCGHTFPFQPVPDDGIKKLLEQTKGFCLFILKHFPIENHPAAYFNQVYEDAIHRTAKGCNLDYDSINNFVGIFEQIFKPVLEN